MRTKRVLALGLAVLGGVAVVAVGCNSSKDDEERRVSRKGEACQVTNDCADGLACGPVPGGAGGVCVTAVFQIAPTAKECVISQCKEPTDCCPVPPATCNALSTSCEAGVNTACTQYDQLCRCDGNKYECEQNRCRTRCLEDLDCRNSGAGNKCAGGKCAQCVENADCSPGTDCVNGTCIAPCQSDGDCPGFNRCSSGKCVEGGCKEDRECVASTRNVEATCGTDGKCIVPCQTDLECGNPQSYSFFSCINRQCTYVGCQSDKDCRLFLTGPSDAGTLPPKTHVECRDRTTPGAVTRPAP